MHDFANALDLWPISVPPCRISSSTSVGPTPQLSTMYYAYRIAEYSIHMLGT